MPTVTAKSQHKVLAALGLTKPQPGRIPQKTKELRHPLSFFKVKHLALEREPAPGKLSGQAGL